MLGNKQGDYFRDAFTLAFSALIRANKTEAGSSLGSCGTSSPENAFLSIDWRNASACCREVVIVWSSWSISIAFSSICSTIVEAH